VECLARAGSKRERCFQEVAYLYEHLDHMCRYYDQIEAKRRGSPNAENCRSSARRQSRLRPRHLHSID